MFVTCSSRMRPRLMISQTSDGSLLESVGLSQLIMWFFHNNTTFFNCISHHRWVIFINVIKLSHNRWWLRNAFFQVQGYWKLFLTLLRIIPLIPSRYHQSVVLDGLQFVLLSHQTFIQFRIVRDRLIRACPSMTLPRFVFSCSSNEALLPWGSNSFNNLDVFRVAQTSWSIFFPEHFFAIRLRFGNVLPINSFLTLVINPPYDCMRCWLSFIVLKLFLLRLFVNVDMQVQQFVHGFFFAFSFRTSIFRSSPQIRRRLLIIFLLFSYLNI